MLARTVVLFLGLLALFVLPALADDRLLCVTNKERQSRGLRPFALSAVGIKAVASHLLFENLTFVFLPPFELRSSRGPRTSMLATFVRAVGD